MNGGAELLRTVPYYDCTFSFRLKYKNPIIAKPIPINIFEALVWQIPSNKLTAPAKVNNMPVNM